MFTSVQALAAWLAENEKLTIVSPPATLTQWTILRQSVASGDFNPAHCTPQFAPHSFFKGVVSHGSGIITRAEGTFLQLVQFENPVETIALGLENVPYRSPLRCGDEYWYIFEISNLRQRRNRWDCNCQITCKAISPGQQERMITTWMWHPSFIEPGSEVSAEYRALLRPRSYWPNILHYVVPPVAAWLGKQLLAGSLAAVALGGLGYVVSTGVYRTAEMNYQVAQYLCGNQPTCYYGTGP